MPGGPPSRQRTSSSAGGPAPASSAASDPTSISGCAAAPTAVAAPLPEAIFGPETVFGSVLALTPVDNLPLPVDKPRGCGGFPNRGCGQTSDLAGLSACLSPQPGHNLRGVPVGREHRIEDMLDPALAEHQG